MTTPESTSDVLIIGGGPAGSTAASFLAMSGHKVLLLEKERFPREHVGESLLPFCHTILRDLGVLDEMKRTCVRKPGVRFISADGKDFTSWCFDRVINDESYLSFQVTRSWFDRMLLDNARGHGATCCEGVTVSAVDLDEPYKVTATARGPNGEESTHKARFLLDASGRDTFIGKKMRWREANKDLDRTAFWTHYTAANLHGGLEEGLSIIVYLGGDKKGWAWVFPLAGDRVTVGFVSDNAYLRTQKKKLKEELGSDWQLALLERELRRSRFISGVLEGARQSIPLQINADYSYSVKEKYGSNFALIGDAARFIDPIFSSGIFLSMKTAQLVASALDELFRHGRDRGSERLVAAYKLVDGGYNFVHRMIKLFYNPHAISWAQASALSLEDERSERHKNAMAAGHYMLAGDFFENHEKYHVLFDLLEDPTGFRRYKKLVIDSERFDDHTCAREHQEPLFPQT